jgi:hypothetical protein
MSSPFQKKFSAKSPIGETPLTKKSPCYQIDPTVKNELKPGEKKEGRPTFETSTTGDIKKGRTTTFKTTQPVVRTEEGDKAYAAKSQKERDIQDAKFKRNMTSTRTVSSKGAQKLKTAGPSSDVKINKAKLQERLDPVEKFKYTSEKGTSYGGQSAHGSTGYVFDADQAGDILNTNRYVKLEGVRKSGKKFDVLQKGKSRGLAPGTTVKEDLAKGRRQVAADRSAKAKADILAKRAEKKKAKN